MEEPKYKGIEPEDLKVGMKVALPVPNRKIRYIGWVFCTVDFIMPDRKGCILISDDGTMQLNVDLTKYRISEIDSYGMFKDNCKVCEEILGKPVWESRDLLRDDVMSLTPLLIRAVDILW